MAKYVEPKIDPELHNFLPHTNADDDAELRQSLIADGQRDPGIVDRDTGKLVDGFRRYRITKSIGLKFRYVVMDFKDMDDMKTFMILNQVARRNLSRDQMSYYRGEIYNLMKQKKPEARLPTSQNETQAKETGKQGDFEHAPSPETAEILADKFDVSEATIKRDAAYNTAAKGMGLSDQAKAGTVAKKDVLAAAPAFCARCTRVGPTPKCQECKSLREKKKLIVGRGKLPRPNRNGRPKYDWNNHDRAFGLIARSPDAIAAAYPAEKDGYEYRETLMLLQQLAEHFKVWKKRTLASGG